MKTLMPIWDNDIGVTGGFVTPVSPGGSRSWSWESGRVISAMRQKTSTGSSDCCLMCIKIACLYRVTRVSAPQENPL